MACLDLCACAWMCVVFLVLLIHSKPVGTGQLDHTLISQMAQRMNKP